MKIGIVEDELIIADSIAKILTEIGYEVAEPALSYAEAVAMFEEERPDLVLLDIQIRGKKDGIELARYMNEHYIRPFIFLTANADAATVARAKEVNPPAYLVKPFNKDDLYASIEICLNNFSRYAAPVPEKKDRLLTDALFVKEGISFQKLSVQDILYVKSDHVYVTVVTPIKKTLIRSSLQQFLDDANTPCLFRVHRGYAVNLQKIEKINGDSVTVEGAEVPLSKTYRDDLLAVLRLI